MDIPIVGDVAHVLEDILKIWKSRGRKTDAANVKQWQNQIAEWRKINCLAFTNSEKSIKPQYALQRLEELTKSMIATSPPRWVSTRCGRRSTLGSKTPTAG